MFEKGQSFHLFRFSWLGKAFPGRPPATAFPCCLWTAVGFRLLRNAWSHDASQDSSVLPSATFYVYIPTTQAPFFFFFSKVQEPS